MSDLVAEESGVVYTNPAPELRHIHAMQPSVRAVSGRELLCTYRRGEAMESVYSVLGTCRSTDGGRTWSDEGLIEQAVSDEGPTYSYFCPHLTRLADGRLVILSVRFRRDDPNQRCYNPDTGGCLPPDTTIFVSGDGGATWTEPAVIAIDSRYAYAGGPVVELADRRWMVVFETWKPFDDPTPVGTRLFALFSSDAGRTWGDETQIFSDPTGTTRFWDVSFTPLGGETVAGWAWAHDTSENSDLPHHRLTSRDSGTTWESPVVTNRLGQVNAAVRLPDGRLFSAYNLRHGSSPGVYGVISEDEGLTWDLEGQVRIWDAIGRADIGERKEGSFLEELASFAFGKPDAVLVDGNRVVVTHWATRACVPHIRWCRLGF